MTQSDSSNMSDEQLVKYIRDSHPEQFREIIERYQKRLFRYCLTFVYDQEKAEDILQDSFIKIYTGLNSFDANKKFSSWAYRIVHNEAINYLKKHKKEVSLDEYEDWLNNIADERVDLAADMDRKIEREKVRRAVFLLPMKYREVVMLYYFEGKEYEQISAVLHIPTSTVGTRILRAKKKLKKMLENKEQKDE